MKLHELKPNTGAKKSRTRRGRGNASKGTYSGRGMKGQNARSGGGVRVGFEGGQSTLIQRMPKRRGFKNPNRVEFSPVNLDRLEEKFNDGDTVSLETLKEKNLIRYNSKAAKVLGRGDITKKLTIEHLYVSVTAKAKIEKAGGKVEDEQVKAREIKGKKKKEKAEAKAALEEKGKKKKEEKAKKEPATEEEKK